MKGVLVSDIMTRQSVTVKPDTSLLECAKMMVRKKVGSLILVRDKKIVGLITNRDILWAIVKKSRNDLSDIKASDISPRKLITIKPSATIDEAIDKIKKFKFYRLPVVQNGELAGVITVRDILTFHPEVYSQIGELESIKEETAKLKRVRQARGREEVRDGICEECGERAPLYRENGMLICASCLSSM
jgi:CBS domain-containing protein